MVVYVIATWYDIRMGEAYFAHDEAGKLHHNDA